MASDDSPSPVDDSVEIRELRPGQWYRLRSNPLRIPFTLSVCEVCKVLPVSVKNRLYRAIGVDVGSDVVIAPHVQVDPLFPERLSVGENTVVGWGTKLLTHEAYTEEWHVGPVEIGSDVTFGHSSSTRPGVTIGDGATVAAHSFVNRDVEPGETVGGVPIETL